MQVMGFTTNQELLVSPVTTSLSCCQSDSSEVRQEGGALSRLCVSRESGRERLSRVWGYYYISSSHSGSTFFEFLGQKLLFVLLLVLKWILTDEFCDQSFLFGTSGGANLFFNIKEEHTYLCVYSIQTIKAAIYNFCKN